MISLARRGRRIYLVLATILIAWQLYGVGMSLFRGWTGEEQVDWLGSIARPLIFVGIVSALRNGDRFNRWIAAVWMWISGALPVLAAVMLTVRIAAETPPEGAGFFIKILGPVLGFLAVFGLAKIAIGCAILWLPSLRAYFEHERLRRLSGWTVDVFAYDAAPPSSTRPRS